MSACLNCHREIPDGLGTCPHCGADLAKLAAMMQGPNRREGRLEGRPARRPATAPGAGSPLGKIALAVLAMLVLGYLGYRMFRPRIFPTDALPPAQANTVEGDPCLARSRCLVIYIAPWCPACKAALRVLPELGADWQERQDVGFKVIVGNGSPGEVEAMAEKIGPGIYTAVDPDGVVGYKLQDLGFEGIPHWYVLDPRGRIQKELGGFGPLPALLKALDL